MLNGELSLQLEMDLEVYVHGFAVSKADLVQSVYDLVKPGPWVLYFELPAGMVGHPA